MFAYTTLNPAGWSWLSNIRDKAFNPFEFADGSADVRLAIDALETRLAQVGNMLLAIDEMVADEKDIDLIRASITGTLALLGMTEKPFAVIVEECSAARLLRAQQSASEDQTEPGPETAPDAAPGGDSALEDA